MAISDPKNLNFRAKSEELSIDHYNHSLYIFLLVLKPLWIWGDTKYIILTFSNQQDTLFLGGENTRNTNDAEDHSCRLGSIQLANT